MNNISQNEHCLPYRLRESGEKVLYSLIRITIRLYLAIVFPATPGSAYPTTRLVNVLKVNIWYGMENSENSSQFTKQCR